MPDLPPAGPSPAPSSWRERLDDLADRFGVEPVRLVVGVVVAVIVVVVVLVVIGGRGASGAQTSSSASSRSPGDVSILPPATTSTTSVDSWVDVTGAVAHPGVYRLPSGARATDAVAVAGGPSSEGDLESINLAARVTDGQRIYVPRRGEAVPADPAATASDARIDLNTATADQLDTLPGVGPATAKAIIDWRQQHGRFQTVDDLLHIRGLGRSRVDALRPKVVVQ
jgi:competence protein ComEA